MKVLVTGATGNVGSAVVAELLKRGADVRALIRKPDAAHKLRAGVEVAIGDLLDPVSIEEAMVGVHKLFLLNAVVADELTQALIAYGIAKRIGLKHVTYLSVFRVEEFRDVPHFASKLAVEGALREFGVPYTILRPGYYMQNDIGLRDALRTRPLRHHRQHRRSRADLDRTRTPQLAEKLVNAQKELRAIKLDEQPQDLAGPVFLLCSPDADFVSGQMLVVDGGKIKH